MTIASITISSNGGSSDSPATTSGGSDSVNISLTPSTSVSSYLNTNDRNIRVTTSIVSVTNVDTGDVLGSNGLTVSYTYNNGNYTISLGNMNRNGLTKGTTYAVEILITSTSGSGPTTTTTTNLSETITVYVKA
ncbi:MAG: hypothetical protein SNH66_02565 [Rikenellaceae bacterium]